MVSSGGLLSINFTGKKKGWIVGLQLPVANFLLNTEDGGLTWIRQPIPSPWPLAHADFADDAQSSGLGKLKAAGMTIVTDVDTGAFQKAMEGMSDRLAKVAGPDAIARMKSLVA